MSPLPKPKPGFLTDAKDDTSGSLLVILTVGRLIALVMHETGLCRKKGAMDNFTKEIRSKIMASVRSQGNRTTERALGRIMWKSGLRGYRKHWPVEGRPDFAWPGLKVAIFVD